MTIHIVIAGVPIAIFKGTIEECQQYLKENKHERPKKNKKATNAKKAYNNRKRHE